MKNINKIKVIIIFIFLDVRARQKFDIRKDILNFQ